MLICALKAHVKKSKMKILSKKLCQFIFLEIEIFMECLIYALKAQVSMNLILYV